MKWRWAPFPYCQRIVSKRAVTRPGSHFCIVYNDMLTEGLDESVSKRKIILKPVLFGLFLHFKFQSGASRPIVDYAQSV